MRGAGPRSGAAVSKEGSVKVPVDETSGVFEAWALVSSDLLRAETKRPPRRKTEHEAAVFEGLYCQEAGTPELLEAQL